MIALLSCSSKQQRNASQKVIEKSTSRAGAKSDNLYNEYHLRDNPDTADALLNSLSVARKTRWIITVEEIDIKHSSRKAWNLLRKIDPNNKRKKHITEIKANT